MSQESHDVYDATLIPDTIYQQTKQKGGDTHMPYKNIQQITRLTCSRCKRITEVEAGLYPLNYEFDLDQNMGVVDRFWFEMLGHQFIAELDPNPATLESDPNFHDILLCPTCVSRLKATATSQAEKKASQTNQP